MIDGENPKPDARSHINAQQAVSAFQPPVRIIAHVAPVELTFHLVTADQIQTYAQMGQLAQLSLALCGLFAGAAIGFWTALQQAGLSPVGNATLNTAKVGATIGAGLTLCLVGLFLCLQHKRKAAWFTSTWPSA